MRPKTFLAIPDCHVPFHNKPLLKKVCQLSLDIKPDGMVIMGDFGDYFSVSRHNQGSLGRLANWKLSDEYDEQAKVLNDLCAAAGRGTEKHFLYGNHEDMFNRYMESGDNAKVGKALLPPYQALHLERRGFKFYTNWKDDRLKLGAHLDVIHGQFTSTHVAKKHLDEMEGSILFAHCHRVQTYTTGRRGAYGIGWLGDVTSPAFNYAPWPMRSKWMNCFALIHILDDGTFIPQIVQCWSGKFIFNGKLY